MSEYEPSRQDGPEPETQDARQGPAGWDKEVPSDLQLPLETLERILADSNDPSAAALALRARIRRELERRRRG